MSLKTAFIGLIALAITSAPAQASPRPDFYCEVPGSSIVLDTLPVSPKSNEGKFVFSGDLYYLDEKSVTLEAYPIDIEFAHLERVPSASGEKFEKEGISFHYKADEGVFTLPDGIQYPCTSAELKYPSAQSLFGSIIRDKPDASAKILTKIPKGYELTISEKTGVVFDDWQWVEVQYDGFESGFIWGGTLCTIKREVSGVHFGCQ